VTDHNKSLLYVHVAIFLFGFSALFARLVDQGAVVITFGRVFFSSAFLFLLIKYNKLDIRLDSKRDYGLIFAAGIILAIHWYCFIQSIQLSTVAIGTITFSTFPVFTSFLEPLFFKGKIKIRTVVCSMIVLFGVFIIAQFQPNEDYESGQRLMGIIVGLFSSFTFAILSLLNRSFSAKYRPEIIVFYEQATAAIVLLPFMFVFRPAIAVYDLILLAVLGIIFTAVSHGLFVKGLRHIEVSTAGIISGLEAVYAIVLASILLREFPMPNEIIGGIVVITMAGYITFFKQTERL
jgi:drug/metabolite transporter (DMT)-like permease